MTLCLNSCLFFAAVGTIGYMVDNDVSTDAPTTVTTIDTTTSTTTTTTTTRPTTTTTTAKPTTTTTAPPAQGTRGNPYIITAQELAKEINSDIDAAKEKYNGKWVKITGKITDFSDGGIIYGYYLYGKKGASGLRIVCWCDNQHKGSMIGSTYTFVGQLREVTTFNATEIGDCEVVK